MIFNPNEQFPHYRTGKMRRCPASSVPVPYRMIRGQQCYRFVDLRRYAAEYGGSHCEACKQLGPCLEQHHIVPRTFGGLNRPGNLVTLCPTCHRIADRLAFSYQQVRERAVLMVEIWAVLTRESKIWPLSNALSNENRAGRQTPRQH